jgi:hypothetical protein
MSLRFEAVKTKDPKSSAEKWIRDSHKGIKWLKELFHLDKRVKFTLR